VTQEKPPFVHQVEDTPEAQVLILGGWVDCTRSTDLMEMLDKMRKEKPKNLVIDLGAVSHIDSAGLGVLVAERTRRSQAGCKMRLCSVSPNVMRVFEASRLDRVLDIQADRQSALIF